jgi:hypothetical protein
MALGIWRNIGHMTTDTLKHLPFDIEDYMELPGRQLPLELVDLVADGLVRMYENPDYRKWYCGVVYEFGLTKVNDWIKHAKDGNEPGKLFTRYVNGARNLPGKKEKPNES